MPFIGNAPSNNFVSLKRQDITGDGTASYTLDHSVASVNDVLIYVNHVKQDPSSYTISNTSLTMGGTVASTDDFYIIYLGQGLQTVTPANNTITSDMIVDGTLDTATLADDAVTKAKTSNLMYPAFEARVASDTSFTDETDVKIAFDTENFDTDSCYDNATNYRFTPTTAGKYYVYLRVNIDTLSVTNFQYGYAKIHKNGSELTAGRSAISMYNTTVGREFTFNVNQVVEFNGSTDYIEAFIHTADSSGNPEYQSASSIFGAFRIGD